MCVLLFFPLLFFVVACYLSARWRMYGIEGKMFGLYFYLFYLSAARHCASKWATHFSKSFEVASSCWSYIFFRYLLDVYMYTRGWHVHTESKKHGTTARWVSCAQTGNIYMEDGWRVKDRKR